jgi:hypothetical protein
MILYSWHDNLQIVRAHLEMGDLIGDVQEEQFTIEVLLADQILGVDIRSVRLWIVGNVAREHDHLFEC